LLLPRFDGPGSYIMVARSFVKDDREALAEAVPAGMRYTS
jgi:hypothetical protein